MALVPPSAPLVIPSFTVPRGPVMIDPATKSTLALAVAFSEDNVCGETAYILGSISANINELTPTCDIIQAGGISVKLRVPYALSDAQIETAVDALWNLVKDELKIAMKAYNA